jgi:hypothetical protein
MIIKEENNKINKMIEIQDNKNYLLIANEDCDIEEVWNIYQLLSNKFPKSEFAIILSNCNMYDMSDEDKDIILKILKKYEKN